MKNAHSNLLDAFLFNVKTGLLTGREGTSGPVILQQIAEALQSILNGVNPDIATETEKSGRTDAPALRGTRDRPGGRLIQPSAEHRSWGRNLCVCTKMQRGARADSHRTSRARSRAPAGHTSDTPRTPAG